MNSSVRAALAAIVFAFAAWAQSPAMQTKADRGFYPNGSFSPSEFDTINNVNGNMIGRIPITTLGPGRGGSQFSLNLVYNSALLDTTPALASGTLGSFFKQNLEASLYGGWQLAYQYGLIYEARPTGGAPTICDGSNEAAWLTHKLYLKTPDGGLKTLRLQGYLDLGGDGYYGVGPNKQISGCSGGPTAPGGDLIYTTIDGSYLRVEISYNSNNIMGGCSIPINNENYWKCRLWSVSLPDGSQVRGYGERSFTSVDRNGNEIYFSSYLNGANVVHLIEDQTGRFIEIEKQTNKDVVRKLGYNQQTLAWEIDYQTIQAVNGPRDYTCAGGSTTVEQDRICTIPELNFNVVSKVSFPTQTVNGQNYFFEFAYKTRDIHGWGELSEVKFPRRDNVSYNSRAVLKFDYLWDDYQPTPGVGGRRDFTRKLENPVKKRTLNYWRGEVNSESSLPEKRTNEFWDYSFTDTSSTITLPDGQTQSASFYDASIPWQWNRGLVYAETMPLGRSVSRTWKRNPPYGPTASQAAANAYVWSESQSIGAGKTVTRSFRVDRNGNQLEVQEGDWIASILRRTKSVYLNGTTVAPENESAPASDEANGYWRQGPRKNVRAAKRIRLEDSAGITRSLREMDYDATWNVTQARSWDSSKPMAGSAPGEPSNAADSILNVNNAVLQSTSFTENNVFQMGNPLTETDPNGSVRTLSYGNISGCSPTQPSVSNLFPTTRVEGSNASIIARTFNLTYDCNTGVVKSEADANNGVSTTRDYDAFGRLTRITAPNGHRTEMVYLDGNNRTAEYRDVKTIGDQASKTIRHYDDLGRVFLEANSAEVDRTGSLAQPSLENLNNGVLVERLYAPPCRSAGANCDAFRYEAVSTPRRKTTDANWQEPEGWTRTKFDSLGRPIEVKHYSTGALPFPWATSDNPNVSGVESTSYNADVTTSTDANLKTRSSRVDGFGRLVEVIEAPGVANFGFSTTYSYDVNDNLVGVAQGSRNRQFFYTSLNRLRQTVNPESGTIDYTYDNAGNLKTRSDSRAGMTVSSYDALGRPTGKTFSGSPATPTVGFVYDSCPYGKGRLCEVTTTKTVTSEDNEQTSVLLEYDNMGRVEKRTQKIGSGAGEVTRATTQSYVLNGLVNDIEYPTSTVAVPRRVSYEYWPNGQVKGVWQGAVGTGSSYIAVDGYWGSGAERKSTLGNGVVEATTLNERMQMTGRSWTQGGTTLLGLGLAWGTSQNNGNLVTQTMTGVRSGATFNFQQDYEYDALNRLQLVKDNGVVNCGSASWRQKYIYDRYGNRALRQGSCPGAQLEGQVWVDSDSASAVESQFPDNRLPDGVGQPARHDGSGNVVRAAGNVYVYDAENRLVKATAGGFDYYYRYNGEGKRVAVDKKNGTTIVETRLFHYGAGGELLAETAGTLPAAWDRKYVGVDHLGSTRLVMKASGTGEGLVDSRHDYFPFGEEVPERGVSYGDAALKVKFTGKERDGETGLDYFGARYMSATMGRWTSPDEFFGGPSDPVGTTPAAKIRPLPFADIHNPQSINKYGYVLGNPVRYTDPDGHCVSGWDTLLCLAAGGFIAHKVIELIEARNLLNEAALFDEYYAALLNRAANVCALGSSECAAAIEAARRAQRSRHQKTVKAAIATAGIPGTVLGGPLTTGKVDTAVAGLVEPVMLNFQSSMNAQIDKNRKDSKNAKEEVRPKSPSEPLCLKSRDGKCIP